MSDKVYYSRTGEDGQLEVLITHLLKVGALTSEKAARLGFPTVGAFVGTTHDIGKASDKWQKYLLGKGKKIPHSQVAALFADDKARKYEAEKPGYYKVAFPLLAYPGASHHTELRDYGTDSDLVNPTLMLMCNKYKDVIDLKPYISRICVPPLNPPEIEKFASMDAISKYFIVKFIAAMLTDSDKTAAEAFNNKESAILRSGYDSLEKIEKRVNRSLEELYAKAPKTPINIRRKEISDECASHYDDDTEYFTLTAPTGAGKTLTLLRFALLRAIKKKKQRIIICLPYCTIINQSYKVIMDYAGRKNVVAHFSEYIFKNSEIEQRKQLSTENWDAPIILTTDVQFFESMYGNNISVVRKLANLPDSIIIFDEAQRLPAFYIRPCVASLSFLMEKCNCTIVMSTATQPALQKYFDIYLDRPLKPVVLCEPVSKKDKVFDRVSYLYIKKKSNDEIAEMIAKHHQALCIVSNKKEAITISKMVSALCKNVTCLTKFSTSYDIRNKVAELIQKLENGEECIVISTSLIEAGIDISFPVVYKATSGLDSIVQAGGRCNRNGLAKKEDSFVYIFDAKDPSPSIMRDEIDIARRILNSSSITDISSPEAIEKYFKMLFARRDYIQLTDCNDIIKTIRSDIYPYATVANSFKVISEAYATVYIFRDKAGKKVEKELRSENPGRDILRRMGPYGVSVTEDYFNKLANSLKIVKKISDNSGILLDLNVYSPEFGLRHDL